MKSIINKYAILILFAISLNGCKKKKSAPSKAEILTQIEHISKAKEYSDYAIQIMNLEDSLIVSQNRVDSYIELFEKSIKEARKVDTIILNQIKNDYGHEFHNKYIMGMEMQLIGYKEGNSKSLSKGQIMYDEYLDWYKQNIK